MVVMSAPCFSAPSVTWHERTRLAVDVDGAGAAERHAAAVLGAGEVEVVAQDPQQRRVAGNAGADVDAFAVDEESGHRETPEAPRRAEGAKDRQ